MEIYIVTGDTEYEGSEILAVFTKRQLAEDYITKVKKKGHFYDGYTLVAKILDSE